MCEPELDCPICGLVKGDDALSFDWLPMYEGKVVKQDSEHEWAAMIVCSKCYDKYTEMEFNYD